VRNVDSTLPIPSLALDFSKRNWTIPGIELASHDAVVRYNPDFELLVTGNPPGPMKHFGRRIGYQPREALVAILEQADIGVVPSIAQEPLRIIALELMAAGCAVVASRIGGGQFSIADGFTGLLLSRERRTISN
jgi:glycosyltransferase involved in cell wall biosynthesis